MHRGSENGLGRACVRGGGRGPGCKGVARRRDCEEWRERERVEKERENGQREREKGTGGRAVMEEREGGKTERRGEG